jgi:hypothetical protein
MAHQTIEATPMISPGFVTRVTLVMSALAIATIAISIAGKWYGESIASDQYTDSTSERNIVIGLDQLVLPDNAIRFPQQRADGEAEQVNLMLQWPQMTGYDRQNAGLFLDVSGNSPLIFIQISQATMTRDMSGRVGPIYSRLFAGHAEKGPAGLSLHHFRQGSGYGDEVLLTDPKGGAEPFAVRCLLPASPATATNADCQRDIRAGKDLNVEYRFSSTLLGDWKDIDTAMKEYVASHLAQ